ncbi:gliding motility-associated C-terminal domain-containing protein, partial [Allomuricauda sp. F6463D]|uniref:T9SS type B sorting domain-containing protein n=1 Tax=Allomuricauda sp. F6463D TaxID=2926409 RepID=UPI001FF49DDA
SATIDVTTNGDTVIEADEVVTVTLNSTDNGTLSATDGEGTSSFTDDDVVGFTIVESDGSTVTSETGGTDTFTVVLDSQPVTDVVFDITSSDTSEGTVDLTSLTFTNANWNTPQEVTVTGVNDIIIDGTQTYNITVSVNDAASDDNFDGLSNAVSVNNTDDDVAGFTIVESDGTTVTSETGDTDTFTVVLNRGPFLGNVVLDIESENLVEGTVSPSTLTFTTGNWDTPQEVTITGVDDALLDGAQNFNINVSVDEFNSAISYLLVPGQTVSVTNMDDDSASVTIADASGNEDSGPITVSATLNNAVVGGFSVNVSTVDGTATTADSDYTLIAGQTLEFDGNAGEVQTFEVIPTADAKIEADESLTIRMDNLAGTAFTVDILDTATITINNDDSCRAGTTAPTINATGTAFCDAFNQELDLYVSDAEPVGTELRWSTNSDISVSGDYLGSSVVNTPGTYYGFFYDATNDCFSNATPVTLTQSFTPSTGTASNLGACSDATEGVALVDLDSSLSDADPGDWVLLTAPAGASVSINVDNIINFDGQPEGDYTFRYTTTGATGTCSNQSVDITVTVNDCSGPCDAGNTAPQFNGVDTTIAFCDVVDANLSSYVTGTAPAGTVLTWSTSNIPSESEAHLNNPNVVEPGTYYGFYYDAANDCGSPLLALTLIRNFTATIDSTDGGVSCGPSILDLTASASVEDESTISYTWYDAPTGGNIVGTSDTFTTNTLSETTSFYVTASANGCESERVEVIATIYNELSAGIPIEDLTVCNVSSDEGTTTFDLDDGLMGQDAGTWTLITDPSNGDLTIGTGNSIDFTGLASGAYVFEYTTDPVGDCTETSSVQLTITVQDCITNEAIDLAIIKEVDDDKKEVLLDTEVTFTITVENTTMNRVQDIVVSDVLEAEFEYLSSSPSKGNYDETTGEWTIDELVGEESVSLEISVRVIELGTLANTATLLSSVPEDDTTENNMAMAEVKVIPTECVDPGTLCNIFSPNGDEYNQTLKFIDPEDEYTKNSLEIFDRYGNSVFQMDGYDSSWDGTGKNGDLPNGTYFYILDLDTTDGSDEDVVKGWIQIVR